MQTPRTPAMGRKPRGQAIVIFALAVVAVVGMVALVLEGGNAFAQQRITQNGADAVANAGAVVLAERLGGATRTDAQVNTAMQAVGSANTVAGPLGWYTDVAGNLLRSDGSTTTDQSQAVAVGSGVDLAVAGPFQAKVAGVRSQGTRIFQTFFARVFGISDFRSTADATAVAGTLQGGSFLPVVFPINIVDCETNGDTGTGEANWIRSEPGDPPVGQEYIVPLCKTGGGSFQILDFDPDLKCDEEVSAGTTVNWPVLPVDVPSDNGNNCAKPITDYVNANLQGEVVLIPICETDCVTTGGSKASYTIVKVAAFYVDYMSDSNNPNNSLCQAHDGLVTIAGNGSSSCIAGWFVRYVSAGPVGYGAIGNSDAIGIQLIR